MVSGGKHTLCGLYEDSVRWYRLTAEQGNTSVQNSLRALYKNGREAPRLIPVAKEWYQKFVAQDVNPESATTRRMP